MNCFYLKILKKSLVYASLKKNHLVIICFKIKHLSVIEAPLKVLVAQLSQMETDIKEKI